jgi:hypothetical protein
VRLLNVSEVERAVDDRPELAGLGQRDHEGQLLGGARAGCAGDLLAASA